MRISHILSVLIVLLIAGCVQTTPQSSLNDTMVTRYSAASSKSKAFTPRPSQSFSWYKKGVIWSVSEQDHLHKVLAEHMLSEFKKALQMRGYQFFDNAPETDYVMGVVVMEEGVQTTTDVPAFFRVSPGIAAEDGLKTVTVVVAVLQNDPWILAAGDLVIQNSLLWRSSVEAFAMDNSVPIDIRKARISELVGVMMASFPV